jgi:hypothetical protein
MINSPSTVRKNELLCKKKMLGLSINDRSTPANWNQSTITISRVRKLSSKHIPTITSITPATCRNIGSGKNEKILEFSEENEPRSSSFVSPNHSNIVPKETRKSGIAHFNIC